MKKVYLKVIGITAVTCGSFLFLSNQKELSITKYHETKLNGTGAPAGRTGAPGESSCTSCHSGSAQDGNAGANTLSLDGGGTDYTPGAANGITLTFNDGAAKNGFQLVALDENDVMAGSFTITDATNTQSVSNGSRDYVTHTGTGNSLDTWSFDWDAPSDAADVTFYVATNQTNSSGGSTGDVIYLSTHTFGNPQASLEEEEETEGIHVGYAVEDHALIIDFPVNQSNDVTVNVIDLSGKSVYFNNEGMFEKGTFTEKVRLPRSIDNGIYVVTLFVGNKPFSKKIMINK